MQLSALLMVGEDIPMTAMNVWVLSYQALTCGVSTMILVSFAFNLVMLGTRKFASLQSASSEFGAALISTVAFTAYRLDRHRVPRETQPEAVSYVPCLVSSRIGGERRLVALKDACFN